MHGRRTHRHACAASAILALLIAPIAACGDASTPETAALACNPLEARERPIELGTVLAVGRDGDGVLYVLVEPDAGDCQVFVSEHGALQRHRVLGSGSSGDPIWYSVSVEAEPPFGLYVQVDSHGEMMMQRFDPDELADKNDVPEGEALEVLSESDIDDLKIRNLPPEVTIEYAGKIEDGRRVLVVRPSDDWSYEDFRVFLGSPAHMFERAVQNVVRTLGGSTSIELTLDGKPATLHFPIEFVDDHVEHGRSTLETDGDTLAITLAADDDPDALEGLNFFCQ